MTQWWAGSVTSPNHSAITPAATSPPFVPAVVEDVCVADGELPPAIVILGYGLNPDGTMRTILRRRVLTGLTVAQFFPRSPIIVTGGNLLATVSYPDGDPSVNVVQFARDVMSPFVGLG